MERLFEAKTKEEQVQVDIAKSHRDKATRLRAIKELRTMNGIDRDDLYAIRSIEKYTQIPNKPRGWNRFHSALIMCNDELLKR